MARVQWTGVIEVKANMGRYGAALKDIGPRIGAEIAPKMEREAKREASWTDRTANARQSLNGRWWQEGDRTIIQLAHGVFYGIFLEIRNGGRFAIVNPILQRTYPQVRTLLRRILS